MLSESCCICCQKVTVEKTKLYTALVVAKSGCIVTALVLVCSDYKSLTENDSTFVCCCERHEKRISDLLKPVKSLKFEIIQLKVTDSNSIGGIVLSVTLVLQCDVFRSTYIYHFYIALVWIGVNTC